MIYQLINVEMQHRLLKHFIKVVIGGGGVNKL